MKAIILFELKYRSRRPVTYLYFALSFVLAFLVVASPTLEVPPFISPNGPYMMTLLSIVTSYVFVLINSAIIGAAILRDFDHSMESIMFSTGISKFDYLFGRFAGSIATLVVINLAVLLGILTAFALGEYVPWNVLWSGRGLQPFDAWNYIQPFLVYSLPNLVITASLFFLVASLSRNTIVIFAQGVLFFIAYQIVPALFKDLNLPQLAALIDPLGLQAFAYETRYWTPQQQDTQLVSPGGIIFYNRLLWLVVAGVSLAAAYFGFSFTVAGEGKKRKLRSSEPPREVEPGIVLDLSPVKRYKASALASAHQIWSGSVFHFRHIRKEATFIVLILSGALLLIAKSFTLTRLHGATSYATTPVVLDLLSSFNLFLILLAIIYSGDLVWKERQVKIAGIVDSLPVKDFVNLLSKLGGLLLIFLALVTALMIGGIGIQTAYGYYNYEPGAYVGVLYGQTFTALVLITIVSLCIHVLINNKFLGYFLCVIFFVINANLDSIGIDHVLFQFASGSLGAYSEMNKFGHFVPLFTWLRIYWLSFGGILLLLLLALIIRGHEVLPKARFAAGRERLSSSVVGLFLILGMMVISSGATIYYNTNIVNKFDGAGNNETVEPEALAFENVAPQPQVVESNLRIDLYPHERDFNAEGFYYLKNLTADSVEEILVSHHPGADLATDYVRFNRMFAKSAVMAGAGRYEIYRLEDPLAPGDSLKMSFKLRYVTQGFKARDENTDIVNNGTYLSSTYLPMIGMREGDEGRNAAPAHGWSPQGEKIRFEATVSTTSNQTAVAPGRLVRSLVEGDRKFFTYVSSTPIANTYAITSARYEVQAGNWNGIPLEIYHHPEHKYNVAMMMTAMKDALQYCAANFGQFPYGELKIVEVPGYAESRKAFSGVIPFSEKLGFVLDVENPPNGLDMCYYLTTHAVANQWWGQQLNHEKDPGNALVTEGLAQHSALMLLKKTFPDETVRRFLGYEMELYLTGRTKEQGTEPTLSQVGDHSYIYKSKAALAFNLLQDFMGEAALNGAIRDFRENRAAGRDRKTAATALIDKLEAAAPDSLKYLVHDLFEKRVVFENKASLASYTQRPDGKYEVRLTFSCKKNQIDSMGVETAIPLDDWIEVGVYSGEGDNDLIYLERKKIRAEDNYLVLVVDRLPGKAGVDPLNKYIDKNGGDNVVAVKRPSAINSLPF